MGVVAIVSWQNKDGVGGQSKFLVRDRLSAMVRASNEARKRIMDGATCIFIDYLEVE